MINSLKEQWGGFFLVLKTYRLWQRICLVVTVALFAVVTFSTMAFSIPYNKLNIALNCALAFFCLFDAFFIFKKLYLGPFVLLVVFLNLWTLISWAVNGFGIFSTSLLSVSLISLVFYQFLKEKKEYREAALSALVLGANLFLLFFIIYYRSSFFNPSFQNAKDRIGAYFENQNAVARWFALSFLGNLYFAYKKQHYWRYTLLPVYYYCILLTGSMTHVLLTGPLATAALMVFMKKKGRIVLGISFSVFVVAFCVAIQFPALQYFKIRVDGFLIGILGGGSSYEDESLAGRTELLLSALSLFLRKPIFGRGFFGTGTFAMRETYAHNNMAELLADFGIIGFVLYFLIIIYPFFDFKNEKREYRFLSFAWASYFLIVNFLNVIYFEKFCWIALAFLFASSDFVYYKSRIPLEIGLPIGLSKKKKPQDQAPFGSGRENNR
jgi:O-antigen ligase